jgi:hypothetical protein
MSELNGFGNLDEKEINQNMDEDPNKISQKLLIRALLGLFYKVVFSCF